MLKNQIDQKCKFVCNWFIFFEDQDKLVFYFILEIIILIDLKLIFQVNKNWVINFIVEDLVVVCEEKIVWSNSGGVLGYLKVYINLVS